VIGQAFLAAAAIATPTLSNVHVSAGPRPFGGDGPSLATVSPNGDGFRDAATVAFRLDRAATVRLEVVETQQAGEEQSAHVVWIAQRAFASGSGQLVWRPARTTQPRTYILRLTVIDGQGRRRVYDDVPGKRRLAPVVRVQGVDAFFEQMSYAPGELAHVIVSSDASELRAQVFAYSGGPFPQTLRDARTSGIAVTGSIRVDWRAHRDAPARLAIARTGNWRSGLYFLRLQADDGRVGYAPFVVRPRRLGEHRVAVVLSTYTWQAYNFDDGNGDGWGDSWYVTGSQRSVRLDRPFLDFGLPYRFHDWDLTFLSWLAQTGKQVDVLTDEDLDAIASREELVRAYDLIVFPGHEEYVTKHMYDIVQRYRDGGGNLAFLAANNFFWQVRRDNERLTKIARWRVLGRPEAALVGVQYVASNNGSTQAPFVVSADAPSWFLAASGLASGATFGGYGIEIDARADASPPGTQVLATIPDALGPGRTAEMTYYETPAGAKVFAAGALNFAASVGTPPVSLLLENLWARLTAVVSRRCRTRGRSCDRAGLRAPSRRAAAAALSAAHAASRTAPPTRARARRSRRGRGARTSP
jgi:hypothetical protein